MVWSMEGLYSFILCSCTCAWLVASVMSNFLWTCGLEPAVLLHPWDSPGKNTGVGYHFLLQCMKVKSESEVVQSCPTLSDPMGCSLPGFSSMGFSRQEHWSGLPFPSPTHEVLKLQCIKIRKCIRANMKSNKKPLKPESYKTILKEIKDNLNKQIA